MNTRGMALAGVLAAITAIGTVAGGVSAASGDEPTDGSVILATDDSGTLEVLIPSSWSDIDPTPIVHDDGTNQPYLGAATSIAGFGAQSASGLVFTAFPFTDDPQSLIDEFTIGDGCASVQTVPFDRNGYVGVAERGTGCGDSRQALWTMVAASPADSSHTVLLQVQVMSAAEAGDMAAAIDSFQVIPAEEASTTGSLPGSSVPGSSLPGSSVPGDGGIAVPDDGSLLDLYQPVPEGMTRIYDDQARITIVVPDAWNEVQTYGFGESRRIMASPDIATFQADGDVSGVLFIDEPHVDDLQAHVASFASDDLCSSSETKAYEAGILTGYRWVGQNCGPSGQGLWIVAAVNDPDGLRTYRVIARSASEAEDWGLDAVNESFDFTTASPEPPAELPVSSLPSTASAADVANAFITGMADGDGETACSLLRPDYISNFTNGIRSCVDDLSAVGTANSAHWAGLTVAGDETTASDDCGTEGDTGSTSLEITTASGETGCLSMYLTTDGWRIDDASSDIWG